MLPCFPPLSACEPPGIQLRHEPAGRARMESQLRLPGARAARDAAEAATGGKAVSLVRIPLNGAVLGFEVRIRMPGRTQGWCCTVDADTVPPRVRDRRPIPNPALPARRAR